MIELIFVIVIIGILAAVAIPKLAATRDDAKVVKEVQNLATCVSDFGAAYTAEGNNTNLTNTSIKGAFPACNAVQCFTFTGTADGNLTVTSASNGERWCTDAISKAAAQDLNGTHSFGGSKVKL
ncbi:type II secretion system protein [Nitratifractor sp.]